MYLVYLCHTAVSDCFEVWIPPYPAHLHWRAAPLCVTSWRSLYTHKIPISTYNITRISESPVGMCAPVCTLPVRVLYTLPGVRRRIVSTPWTLWDPRLDSMIWVPAVAGLPITWHVHSHWSSHRCLPGFLSPWRGASSGSARDRGGGGVPTYVLVTIHEVKQSVVRTCLTCPHTPYPINPYSTVASINP